MIYANILLAELLEKDESDVLHWIQRCIVTQQCFQACTTHLCIVCNCLRCRTDRNKQQGKENACCKPRLNPSLDED